MTFEKWYFHELYSHRVGTKGYSFFFIYTRGIHFYAEERVQWTDTAFIYIYICGYIHTSVYAVRINIYYNTTTTNIPICHLNSAFRWSAHGWFLILFWSWCLYCSVYTNIITGAAYRVCVYIYRYRYRYRVKFTLRKLVWPYNITCQR